MLLLADSGATKTDWYIGNNPTDGLQFQTEGINPFHQSPSIICTILEKQLLPHLPVSPASCHRIFFYGAGCTPAKSLEVARILQIFFTNAQISVESDLLGAARSACKDHPGIACILGTGSNSCLYDGRQIVRNIPPLGYILGDEGSGAYLGKRFIGDCLKGQLPEKLRDGLLEEYKLTMADILDRVYRQPQANRFLAGFTPYIYMHKEETEVQHFLSDCFREFFLRNILPYESDQPVSFVGSIAWFFRKEIEETARQMNISVGTFVKSPIEGLKVYHF